MNTAIKAAVGASAFAAAALLVPMHASAATEHCDAGGTKIEVKGDTTRIDLNLAPGTPICIKAGTQAEGGFVGADGDVVNTLITNRNGTPLGISYYVVYDGGQDCGSVACPGS